MITVATRSNIPVSNLHTGSSILWRLDASIKKGEQELNKKLMRYLDEADRTEAKIAELQEHLKGVRAAQKAEEDIEIVKSIRSMKLDGRELLAMLTGLQDGTMKSSVRGNRGKMPVP